MASSAAEPFSMVHSVQFGDHNSVTSTEMALSFDHILEQIFNSLDSNDLLNCRLVSYRWLLFAQKPLQEQISLLFSENELIGDNSSPMYLTELTRLLEKGQSLLNAEDNRSFPLLFPCHRFNFKRINLGNDDLQQFFNTNGQNIRELSFGYSAEDSVNENILMDQIANLLLNQARNIQTLYLFIDAQVQWEIGNDDNRNQRSRLRQTDPEYRRICQKTSDLLQSNPGSSLKAIQYCGEGLAKILELIIRISPNLMEVTVDLDSYKYLLEPENRLHMLKVLYFNLEPSYNPCIEAMEIISRANVKLRMIELTLNRVIKGIPKYPDLELRITNMMNRIFKASWDTLEQIEFFSFNFLRGMKFPEVMPRVREIVFRDSRSDTSAVIEANNSHATVFPLGFNMQKTFPKLRWVHFGNYAEFEDITVFSSFLNCFHFGADPRDPLSTSVRRVTVSSFCFGGQNEPLWPSILERIQRWFPNARIERLN